MARLEHDFFALQNQCLSEKGDCELLRVEKLEVFRSFPGPKDSLRKIVFVNAIAVFDLGVVAGEAEQWQSGDKHENGKVSLQIYQAGGILSEALGSSQRGVLSREQWKPH